MEFIIALKLGLLFLCLCGSAFFSASETALFSLDTIKIRRLNQQGKNTFAVMHLLENPLHSLTTILAGNTLANIAVSAIVTSLSIDIFGGRGLGISIGVTTLILLMFGEVTPKTIAIYNSERLAYLFSVPLFVFGRLAAPFLMVATKICDAIIAFFRLSVPREPTLTEEEFRTVMEIGHRHGVVGKSEKEMVVSVLELTTTTALEVMAPRMDIRAIGSHWDLTRAREFAHQAKHSKFPVYKDSSDNILGMVFAKDLFLEEGKGLPELLNPVLFVPSTKKISELIKEFYRQKLKMAIVVDEYGGTSGLVTMEDILEEIFGEIYDEFEVKENLVEALSEKQFRISGKTPIYQVSEDCGIKIPSGEYETIAGFLLDIFGRIPAEGEQIKKYGGVFTIEKVMGRRIKSVLWEKT